MNLWAIVNVSAGVDSSVVAQASGERWAWLRWGLAFIAAVGWLAGLLLKEFLFDRTRVEITQTPDEHYQQTKATERGQDWYLQALFRVVHIGGRPSQIRDVRWQIPAVGVAVPHKDLSQRRLDGPWELDNRILEQDTVVTRVGFLVPNTDLAVNAEQSCIEGVVRFRGPHRLRHSLKVAITKIERQGR